MEKNTMILGSVLIVIIVVATAYGVYNYSLSSSQTPTPTPTPTPTATPTASPSPTTTPTPTPTPTASPTPSPSPTPEPVVVTIDDATGREMEVTLPVERIVCLTSIEIVYAMGAGEKIVGRVGMLDTDVENVLPAYLLEVPSVGDSDYSLSMETLVELEPDLVIASQRLSDENRIQIEATGAVVIEDTLTGDRRNQFLTNLGLILEAEDVAQEFIDFEAYYENLVIERLENITRSEKPLVFFEWYMDYYSTSSGGSYRTMIEKAGGIDIAENVTTGALLSAEFVLEQNPETIIRMQTYYDGEGYAAFVNLWDDMTTRPGISGVTAIVDGKVHIISSTLLVARDVIGLLYFAKWFHPEIFADIDPAAVHGQFVEKFYGANLQGVYVYP